MLAVAFRDSRACGFCSAPMELDACPEIASSKKTPGSVVDYLLPEQYREKGQRCRVMTGERVSPLLSATITAVCISVAIPSVSKAGYDRCEGLVQVGPDVWSIVISNRDNSVCWFESYSKAGHEILAECPNGSVCSISLPLKGEPGAPIEHGTIKRIVEMLAIQHLENPD